MLAHEYGTVSQTVLNYGAKSTLNIWDPYVETGADFSLSQIWVSRGLDGSSLETIEAGWVKRASGGPSRLFVYMTNNSYGAAGPGISCWNADCAFVLTSAGSPVDVSFSAYSVSGGAQVEGELTLQRDSAGTQWMFYYQGYKVGYWSTVLFNSDGLRDHADNVTWGGETFDESGSTHTATDMGSGAFPVSPDSGNLGNAAYQRIMNVRSGLLSWTPANPTIDTATNAGTNCYRTRLFFSSASGNATCTSAVPADPRSAHDVACTYPVH
jgi:hypothetical protein